MSNKGGRPGFVEPVVIREFSDFDPTLTIVTAVILHALSEARDQRPEISSPAREFVFSREVGSIFEQLELTPALWRERFLKLSRTPNAVRSPTLSGH